METVGHIENKGIKMGKVIEFDPDDPTGSLEGELSFPWWMLILVVLTLPILVLVAIIGTIGCNASEFYRKEN